MNVRMNIIINGQFKIIKKIGHGSFGKIYKGQNINNNEYVAIKIEKKKKNGSYLYREGYIYNKLKLNQQSFKHFPESIWCGHTKIFDFLVLPLYSSNIRSYLLHHKWDRSKWNFIAKNSLEAIKNLHKCSILHRDIKPENFVFTSDFNNIMLIDYGLSITFNSTKKTIWVGTPKFASPWIGSDRKYYIENDDLSSWWLMMLWCWNRGKLPWSCDIGKKKLTKKETKKELLKLQHQKKNG